MRDFIYNFLQALIAFIRSFQESANSRLVSFIGLMIVLMFVILTALILVFAFR